MLHSFSLLRAVLSRVFLCRILCNSLNNATLPTTNSGGGRSAGGGGPFGILAGVPPDDDDTLPALPSLLPSSGREGIGASQLLPTSSQAYAQHPLFAASSSSSAYAASTSGTGVSANASNHSAAGVSFDNGYLGGSNSDGSFNSGPISSSSRGAVNNSSSSGNTSGTGGNSGKGTRSLSFGDSPVQGSNGSSLNVMATPALQRTSAGSHVSNSAPTASSSSSNTSSSLVGHNHDHSNASANTNSNSGSVAANGAMESPSSSSLGSMPPPPQQRSTSNNSSSSHNHHATTTSGGSSSSNAKSYAEVLARQVATAEAKGAEMLAVEASQCLLTLAVQVGPTWSVFRANQSL